MDQKILILVANEYEDLELHYPKYRLMEGQYEVFLAGAKKETYKGKHGTECQTTLTFNDVRVSEYAGLVIPGGYSPDHLRIDAKVLEIVKGFHQSQKVIAFICHAGWVPASAGILKGKKCTSVKNIKDDLINAGAVWSDEKVVVDGHLISSRTPEDLPYFCPAILDALRHAKV